MQRKTQPTLSTRHLQVIKTSEFPFQHAPILVAICHRNQPKELEAALHSIERQTLFAEGRVQVVVLDDQSDSHFLQQFKQLSFRPHVTVLEALCGSAAQARNLLLDWADEQKAVQWVARLDADDELATTTSLESLIKRLETEDYKAGLGSNSLRRDNVKVGSVNRPDPRWLNEPATVVDFIRLFCECKAEHELPSCNLILANRAGFRYPNIKSAEDHWLVATLLLLYPESIALETDDVYSIYSLSGHSTELNREINEWSSSRKKLTHVISAIRNVQLEGNNLLGFGMEGVVFQRADLTIKEFHPWGLNDVDAAQLEPLLRDSEGILPQGELRKLERGWQFISLTVNYQSVGRFIAKHRVAKFLSECFLKKIAPINIKRDNLMIHPSGELHYIDIGKDIQPLSVSYFLDLSARLYAVGVLGFSDHELTRRLTAKSQSDTLNALHGFSDFYGSLITRLHPLSQLQSPDMHAKGIQRDTSLLIKSCAQDAEGLIEQITHIVTQLEHPRRFAEKILLIDDHPGPFLRQYAEPDLPGLLVQAQKLKLEGVIDRILIAPRNEVVIRKTYLKWFGTDSILHTHTVNNAPLYNQLWGFDQVSTRYVLQCDCDVLVGRKDWNHDFLSDMLIELKKPDVQSVGFNIPKATSSFLDYFGTPGQFAPEVRCGLLDLKKFNSQLPIDNPAVDNQFSLTWHRAVQRHEKVSCSFRSVRGGDPASFYIHPLNAEKPRLRSGIIRDLIAQGFVPEKQLDAFNLESSANWRYPARDEDIIFLLKGRMTPHCKLLRCVSSLQNQTDGNFGVVLIDDASGIAQTSALPRLLGNLKSRTTLIRHTLHQGRVPNFLLAINQICVKPNSLIVVLDQDDFLMSVEVVSTLRRLKSHGHDLIQMPMFRPNKPLKIFTPDYQNSRAKEGANVWAHLRAFSKALFEKINLENFKTSKGMWFDTVTDYVTMLPMVELADNPTYADVGYAYWHEREDYSKEHKAYQQALLQQLFAKSKLGSPE